MKKLILCVATIVAISLTSCKKEKSNLASTTELLEVNEMTFGVRGNCGMCKRTIEKAAKSIDGVSKAVWNIDKKYIDVSFDSSKTNEMAIHNAIAASGYDTEKVMGNIKAYDKLPGCCKYDHEMDMNQSGNKTKEMALQDYTLDIEGMMCAMCSGRTTAELIELPWIKDLKVSHDDNYATFNLASGSEINEIVLATTIRDLGYKPKRLSFKGEIVNDISKVRSNPKNTKYIYRVRIEKGLEDADFGEITKRLKKIDPKIETSYNEDNRLAHFYTNKKIELIELQKASLDAGYLPVEIAINEDDWIAYDIIENDITKKGSLKSLIISEVIFKDYAFDKEILVELDSIFKTPRMFRVTRTGVRLYNKTPITLDFAKIEKKLQAKFPNLEELQIGDKSKKYEIKE